MSEEINLLKKVTQSLNAAGIPYMITGSIAANFYTIPRMTRDIDVVIELDIANMDRFITLFQDDFYVDRQMIDESLKRHDMFNIIHNEMIIKVDFIIRKDTEYRRTEFERRRQTEVEGVPMWIVSPEDLVLSKLFWAKDSLSEMQLRDVKNILDEGIPLDLQYIEKWTASLGLQEIYERANK